MQQQHVLILLPSRLVLNITDVWTVWATNQDFQDGEASLLVQAGGLLLVGSQKITAAIRATMCQHAHGCALAQAHNLLTAGAELQGTMREGLSANWTVLCTGRAKLSPHQICDRCIVCSPDGTCTHPCHNSKPPPGGHHPRRQRV